MAKLTENTWVEDPKTGAPKFLKEGDVVPTWAADQVGSHLIDDSDDEPTGYRAQKLKDLKAEIDKRNVDRSEADKVNPEGRASIESYALALEADDAKAADGEPEADGAGTGDPGDGDEGTGDGGTQP